MVVFRVDFGVITSVEGICVIFLYAVVGKGMARNLPSLNTPPVTEDRNQEGIYTGAFLHSIKNFVHPLVTE